MKHRFLLLATILLCGCNEQEVCIDTEVYDSELTTTRTLSSDAYYWYQGEKIALTPTKKGNLIVYKTQGKNTEAMLMSYVLNSLNAEEDIDIALNCYHWDVTADATSYIKEHDVSQVVTISPSYQIRDNGHELYVSPLVYVKLKSETDVEKLHKKAEELKFIVLGNNKYMKLWYTLFCNEQTDGSAIDIANQLYESGEFEYAEPDIMSSFCYSLTPTEITPNDTYYSSQWNLSGTNSIRYSSVRLIAQGANVKIGIIDTGVKRPHSDLMVNHAYDARTGTLYANYVYNSHGTNCAGIIGAKANNNQGITGIAPQSQLYSYAVCFDLSPNVSQELSTSIALASETCDVISCSWGLEAPNDMITDAIHYNADRFGRAGKGIVVVFAAGNEGSTVSFPANSGENILAVGASTRNGQRCTYSNYGSSLDVVAPGDSIYTTTVINGYDPYFSGTSAACPQVAAIAALILCVNPDLTNTEVYNIIRSTSSKIGNYTYTNNPNKPQGSWNDEMGYGLVNAQAAVQRTISNSIVLVP